MLENMKRTIIAIALAVVVLGSGCAGDPMTGAGPDAASTPRSDAHARPEASVGSTPGTVLPLAEMVTDVEYKPGKWLGVVSPTTDGPWPTVVILHGFDVPRETYYDLAKAVAEKGAVVFVPEWDDTLPSAADRRTTTVTRGLDDIADAMRFARLNAPQYGGDSNRVVLVGHSLGGAFAMTTTLVGDRFGTDAVSHDVSALPDACVVLDGVVPFRKALWRDDFRMLYAEDPSTWAKINPAHYMDESTVREGVEFRYFVATLNFDDCVSMVARMTKLGLTASVSTIDVGHMEIAQPQTATVEAILELAQRRP